MYSFLVSDDVNRDRDYPAFSYSLISTCGSLLVLISTPIGFTTLTTSGFNLKTPFVSKATLQSKQHILNLELQTIQRKLQGIYYFDSLGPFSYDNLLIHFALTFVDQLFSEDARGMPLNYKAQLSVELEKVKVRITETENASVYEPFVWNVVSLLLTLCNLLFPAYIVLHIVINLTTSLFIHYTPFTHFIQFQQAERIFLGSFSVIVELIINM